MLSFHGLAHRNTHSPPTTWTILRLKDGRAHAGFGLNKSELLVVPHRQNPVQGGDANHQQKRHVRKRTDERRKREVEEVERVEKS
jgi:hypothetical protein